MKKTGEPFELILVDDGSRDESWHTIVALSLTHTWCRGFSLMTNYGQHNAVLCGIRHASYDTIVTMDDDLQHPPEEMPKLLNRLSNDCDCVYGRPMEYRHSLVRNLATMATKLILQKAMGAEAATNIGPFRAFRTRLRSAFANYHGTYVSIDSLLTWGTRKFGVVKVRHETRPSGSSNYTFKKLLQHTVNMMTGFTTLPLRYASIMGLFCAAFGICLLIYVLLKYQLYGGEVPGFSFLASTLLIFSGAQLLGMGIIGEYLARIFSHSLAQPSYLIGETTERPETPLTG